MINQIRLNNDKNINLCQKVTNLVYFFTVNTKVLIYSLNETHWYSSSSGGTISWKGMSVLFRSANHSFTVGFVEPGCKI